MLFKETPLPGLTIIETPPIVDERGYFSRVFCANTFLQEGLRPEVAQRNKSFNRKAGTVRGMHFQIPPATETKLIQCTRGAIIDIVIDLRPESPTFLQYFSVELTEESQAMLYVPQRFAHGYQTLCDDTAVEYQVSAFYEPRLERGLRFDDPFLTLPWPTTPTVVSTKDRSWPLMDEALLHTLRETLTL